MELCANFLCGEFQAVWCHSMKGFRTRMIYSPCLFSTCCPVLVSESLALAISLVCLPALKVMPSCCRDIFCSLWKLLFLMVVPCSQESLHSLRSHLVNSQRQKPKTSNQSFPLKLMETVNGPTHGEVRRRRMKDLPANLLNRHLCPPPLPPPPPD